MKKKILITIIIFIILIFVIHIVRNIIILKEIENLQTKYSQTDNHYQKIENNIQNVITEYYYKDGKSKLIMNRLKDSVVITTTYDGTYKNTYIDNKENKTVTLKEENDILTNIMIIKLEVSNDFKYLFELAMTSFIRSEILEEKECYVISGFDWITKSYFDKETGLIIRRVDNSENEVTNIDYEYKFNIVTDEDLIVPNASEYEIQENN